jgi:hypothetical protein
MNAEHHRHAIGLARWPAAGYEWGNAVALFHHVANEV